jgi:Ca2+-binding EF-hand superfamily protein
MGVNVNKNDYQSRMADRFAAFDRDKDGSVTAADFEAMASKILAEFDERKESDKGKALLDGAQQFWRNLCKVVDASGDERITEQEFVEAAVNRLLNNPDGFTEIVRPWAKAVVAVADTDDDGTVDTQEWARMLQTMGADPDAARQRAADMDLNRDGTVSVDEVIASAVDAFTSENPRYEPVWAR